MIDANTGREFPLRETLSGKIFAQNGHARIMHDVHNAVKPDYSRRAFALNMRGAHNLGMNLRAIRKARRLSQEDLAEMIGKDQATIQRAETMHKSAKLETYIACAEALGVRLEDLFTSDRNDDEALLLVGFRSSGGQARRMMLAMASEAATQDPESAAAAIATEPHSDAQERP